MPHVSVIIPTYNGADFVADAIESVLSQSYADFELLVVDDGSTDDTPEIAQSFNDSRIRIHENERNLGIAKNMNRAVQLADGNIIAFLDQDDYWYPEKLSRHVTAHQEQDAALVYSDVEMVTINGNFVERVSPPKPKTPGEPLVRQLYVSLNFIRTFSGVSLKRSAWMEAGGLNTDYSVSADYELYLRLATEHQFEFVDQSLVAKRRHEGNTSGDPSALYEDVQRILAEARDRHTYLTNLTASEQQEYGFQQAFCAYDAEKHDEAFDYCLTSLQNGIDPLAVLLLGVLVFDRVSGPLQLGTCGYNWYNSAKKARPMFLATIFDR